MLALAAMIEHWPEVCRVKTTFELQLRFSFVLTTSNSMKDLVKLDYTEYARSFQIVSDINVNINRTAAYLSHDSDMQLSD